MTVETFVALGYSLISKDVRVQEYISKTGMSECDARRFVYDILLELILES